jgi:hypothetical protein
MGELLQDCYATVTNPIAKYYMEEKEEEKIRGRRR